MVAVGCEVVVEVFEVELWRWCTDAVVVVNVLVKKYLEIMLATDNE